MGRATSASPSPWPGCRAGWTRCPGTAAFRSFTASSSSTQRRAAFGIEVDGTASPGEKPEPLAASWEKLRIRTRTPAADPGALPKVKPTKHTRLVGAWGTFETPTRTTSLVRAIQLSAERQAGHRQHDAPTAGRATAPVSTASKPESSSGASPTQTAAWPSRAMDRSPSPPSIRGKEEGRCGPRRGVWRPARSCGPLQRKSPRTARSRWPSHRTEGCS